MSSMLELVCMMLPWGVGDLVLRGIWGRGSVLSTRLIVTVLSELRGHDVFCVSQSINPSIDSSINHVLTNQDMFSPGS